MSREKVPSADGSSKKVRMPKDAAKEMTGRSNWAALVAAERRERLKGK
jgi:hypothetical protein